MAFYNPMMAGPDFGGGIQDLISQFMMMQMIQQMYPDDKKKKKGEKETLRGMPKIGEMFLDQSPQDLPPAREMPMGGPRLGSLPDMMNLPMGQPPMGQAQQPQLGETPLPPAREMPSGGPMLGSLADMMQLGGLQMGETPLPSAREMPSGGPRLGSLSDMMQPPAGQGQQPQPDIQQILQMLQMFGGLPGLTK